MIGFFPSRPGKGWETDKVESGEENDVVAWIEAIVICSMKSRR